jgi:hypothetical protein
MSREINKARRESARRRRLYLWDRVTLALDEMLLRGAARPADAHDDLVRPADLRRADLSDELLHSA